MAFEKEWRVPAKKLKWWQRHVKLSSLLFFSAVKNALLRHYWLRQYRFVHVQFFGIAVFSIGFIFGGLLLLNPNFIKQIFASDTTQTWNFSTSGDYTVGESSFIEVAASSARLKVRSYTADANTVLLLHGDESEGNPADSSGSNHAMVASSVSYTSGNLNNAFDFTGTNSQLSTTDSAALSLSQANTLEAWIKLDGSFSAGSHSSDQPIVSKGEYQLYLDSETGKVTYELANSTATNWTQVAGNDINSSWDLDGQLAVHAQVSLGTDMYYALGNAVGDAEVWKYSTSGSTWTKVGGDALNSSWAVNTFESVFSLATDGTDIYAGLGVTAGDAEVWKYTVSSGTWSKIGGDALNSSWALNTFEGVYTLFWQGSTLYAGLGLTATDAEVWSWNGSTWSKIGGDGVNSSWNTTYETVYTIVGDGTNIYAGIGLTAGEAEVWSWNGSAWTKIGGDAVNSSWADATYEVVQSLTYFGGNLYAAIGLTANDAEVWRYNGSAWTQIGGDSLNSGWTTNYEAVYSLANDGTNLYAGLGNTAGDNEVWSWNGSAWTKIGGDGINSGFTTTHTIVDTLYYANSTLYAGMTSGATNRTGEVWSWNGSAWTQIGGDYVNKSWGFRGLQGVETMTVSGDKLYAGTGTALAGAALVWEFDGSNWTLVGGQGVNSSWAAHTYEDVMSMTSYGGVLHVGLGTTANDAEVWRYSGGTWTQIGGDSLNSGWGANYEEISSLASYGGYLYAGLGITASDAEIWRWNGSAWTKIGGDSLNSGWGAGYERVASMGIYNGKLVAGLALTAGEAEVWEWSGSAWSKIGGDTVNSSWDSSSFENVDSLLPFNGKLYAGLGTGTGEAEVWEYNGSAWSKIGGDDVNSSWTDGTYERVRSLVTYNGDLYAGLGNGAGDGEVWRYRSGTWSQVGGDSTNSSWSNVIEEVLSFSPYKGKLYAGTGTTLNTDAAIWSYGGNGYLQSATSSFSTDWHHIAATYDGATMKIYRDGALDNSTSVSLSIPDTQHGVLVGAAFAGKEAGKAQGFFTGLLDEVRISNTARSSFTTTAYSADPQSVRPNSAVLTSGVKKFDAFSSTETTNGGSISYRLSSDGGSTWKYWSGSAWATSSSLTQVNSQSVINANIETFPVGSGGIVWQAVLDGNGEQLVTLNSVSIGALQDTTAPTNPTSVTALNQSGGGVSLTTNQWSTYATPYFSWTGADDGSGAGIAGYYVYFGTDSTADPVTAGTFQEAANYTASSLTSSQTYYLRIRAKDGAQNNASSVWQAFIYKYDATNPTNPGVISISPAGYSANNSFTFSWPSSGSNVATDSGSGVSGYQYKTGTASGTLSNWSSTIAETSVSVANAAYQVGENTFYLRTIDSAGNVSSTPISATYYFAGDGPSVPQFLSVNPSTNTVNSFSFAWNAPEAHSGSASELTYCYTINILPSADSCTFTSAGATSLSASSFATQQGMNTVYVVAKNPTSAGGSINYGAYASATFTANTSAPGIPLSPDIADISIKGSSLWRLTISWSAPSNTGSGVSEYEIFRSSDNETFTKVATTTGTAYVDTGLDEIEYYYKVRACDNVSNCGAYTSVVSDVPTGKYTEAASLSAGPTVSAVTTKQATISWSTDRTSDSRIQYGTGSGSYFSSEPSKSLQTTDHSITLTNLTPGTTYYFKTKWTDEDGNTGVSGEKSFTTDPSPTIADPKAGTISLDSVALSYTAKGASSVKIYYGKTSGFGGIKKVSTSVDETTYTTVLADLEDGTKYFYKINALDSEGAEYEGNILSFETLPRPKISTVRIQQVKNTAQPTALITWSTNTEVSSIVTFYPENNIADARDEVNVALKKGQHQIILRSLQPNTPYLLVAKGRDKAGNEARSEVQRFTTATDSRPPQINNLKVEGNTVKVGDTQQAQLIVSWTTDEEATSQVEFGEGTGTTYSQRTQVDANLKINHLVVISGLAPSKVYHLRAVSRDSAQNETVSIDTVNITPKATDAALDLVITNLGQVFGFLEGIR